jgi:apolipoprotein N-acyltransferase
MPNSVSISLTKKQENLLIVLSAAFSGLAQPGNGIGLLSLVSYTPFFLVLWLSHDKSLKYVAWIAYKFAFTFSLVALYWISFSDPTGFIGTQVTIGLRFSLMAIVFSLLRRFSKSVFLFVPLMVLHEFAYTLTDLDFPWYMAGYSLTDYMFIMQISEYTGIYGVSFFIYLTNALILHGFLTHRLWLKITMQRLAVVCSLFILFNTWIYFSVHTSDAKAVKVGVVQPNIDPFLKWGRENRNLSIDRLFKGTYKSILAEADHIVWPETAVPFRLRSSAYMLDQLQRIADENDVNLTVGSIDSRQQNRRDEHYNSVFHFLHTDSVFQIYDKRRLVPVIEKRIFEGVFDFINNLPGMAGFELGQKNLVLRSQNKVRPTQFSHWGGRWETDSLSLIKTDEIRFATTVCIESNYPELYREFNQNERVQLFNLITNDGWFYPHYDWFKSFAKEWNFSPYLKGKGPIQHQAIAQVRAIETRTSIVRSANTGISSVIDPFGFVIEKTDQYEEDYLVVDAPILNVKQATFYQRFGDVFVTICAAFIILLCASRKLSSVQID